KKQYPSIRITSHPGPLTLIDGTPNDADLLHAARIAGRFSKGRMEQMTVEITKIGGVTTTHTITPMRPDEVKQEWYI
ncbi:MAG: tRNA (5-methylaminomethyl-2-thiouridylate)-methyltransferase, partial [Moraxellaceae bacterium]